MQLAPVTHHSPAKIRYQLNNQVGVSGKSARFEKIIRVEQQIFFPK